MQLLPSDANPPNNAHSNWWVEFNCDEDAPGSLGLKDHVIPPFHGWTITSRQQNPQGAEAGLITIHLNPPPATLIIAGSSTEGLTPRRRDVRPTRATGGATQG